MPIRNRNETVGVLLCQLYQSSHKGYSTFSFTIKEIRSVFAWDKVYDGGNSLNYKETSCDGSLLPSSKEG